MKEYRKLQMFAARMTGKACRALHLTSPAIPSYQLDIGDKPLYKSKSNSWVRNMINIMAMQGMLGASSKYNASFFQDGYLSFRQTSGAISGSLNIGYGLCAATYDAANLWKLGSVYGIQVGSSDTAETFDDYDLGTTIAHGAGAGQLSRSIQSEISKVWDSVNRKWVLTLQRGFVNSSGGNVVVRELGFLTSKVTMSYLSSSSPSSQNYNLLLIRDVLPSPVTIATGQTLTVTYTIEYSF